MIIKSLNFICYKLYQLLFQFQLIKLLNKIEYLIFINFDTMTSVQIPLLFGLKKPFTFCERFKLFLSINYHLIKTEPQVNPAPKAVIRTVSPLLISPAAFASLNAIGIEAAVVFPYF